MANNASNFTTPQESGTGCFFFPITQSVALDGLDKILLSSFFAPAFDAVTTFICEFHGIPKENQTRAFYARIEYQAVTHGLASQITAAQVLEFSGYISHNGLPRIVVNDDGTTFNLVWGEDVLTQLNEFGGDISGFVRVSTKSTFLGG